ncbi:isopeptide-forming domain-containing fimbrial protein [Deinococcus lacus]|uniref:Isopeptide-forming domain-containing fimbrial protein n=1 Tax=Deinococcus lacus TaxID=392561 RepID=A0ABW1YC79_9DEIO
MKHPLHILTTALLAAAGMAAAQTSAGTLIKNRAVAYFSPVVPGEPTTAESNEVVTVVAPICSVSVLRDGTVDLPGQNQTAMAGEASTLAYTITNTGNSVQTFPVTASPVGGSFTPGTTVFLDVNRNGSIDPGEPQVSAVTLEQNASAQLLVRVVTVASDRGSAYVNLVASCADGTGRDGNNVGQVTVSAPPVLSVDKTFTPEAIRPGEETSVAVTTTNTGTSVSREVILTDNLSQLRATGLNFVPGSAQASAGVIEYTADGVTWSTSEPATVVGIRVRAASLAPAEVLRLTFRMVATAAADQQSFRNIAAAQTPGSQASDDATLKVTYTPGVGIGPVGRPTVPDNTPADTQTKPFAQVGQQVCFDHTLRNTGDVRDTFNITVTYPQGGAAHVFYGADGQPLALPVTLEPGQEILVRVCYTPTQGGPFESLITVTGSRGTSNTTRDFATVVSGNPELVKSITSVERNPATEPPTNPDLVNVGDIITYQLSVRNPYAIPLTGVVVSDPLPTGTDYISSADQQGVAGTLSGTPGQEVLSWNVGTLPAGETRLFTVRVRVSERTDQGETIKNVFTMVSNEFPSVPGQPPVLVSNPVERFRPIKIVVTKTVSNPQATIGDRLTYTITVTNPSRTVDLVETVLTDTPNPGLEYIAGSSIFEKTAFTDPVIAGGNLTWNLGRLGAGQTVTLTYDMRVTPWRPTTPVSATLWW